MTARDRVGAAFAAVRPSWRRAAASWSTAESTRTRCQSCAHFSIGPGVPAATRSRRRCGRPHRLAAPARVAGARSVDRVQGLARRQVIGLSVGHRPTWRHPREPFSPLSAARARPCSSRPTGGRSWPRFTSSSRQVTCSRPSCLVLAWAPRRRRRRRRGGVRGGFARFAGRTLTVVRRACLLELPVQRVDRLREDRTVVWVLCPPFGEVGCSTARGLRRTHQRHRLRYVRSWRLIVAGRRRVARAGAEGAAADCSRSAAPCCPRREPLSCCRGGLGSTRRALRPPRTDPGDDHHLHGAEAAGRAAHHRPALPVGTGPQHVYSWSRIWTARKLPTCGPSRR